MDNFHWKISIPGFIFSEKSPNFSQKSQFWPILAENIKILAPKPIPLVVRTNITKNEPNRTIWWWVITFFVIFHKLRFSAWYADFFSENNPFIAEFSFFCIFAYYFQKYLLNLWFAQFIAYLDLFLGELEPFLALIKVPFLGPFYIGFYIYIYKNVQFSDIPGRTRMIVESRYTIISYFCKKKWQERCEQIHMYHSWKWP